MAPTRFVTEVRNTRRGYADVYAGPNAHRYVGTAVKITDAHGPEGHTGKWLLRLSPTGRYATTRDMNLEVERYVDAVHDGLLIFNERIRARHAAVVLQYHHPSQSQSVGRAA